MQAIFENAKCDYRIIDPRKVNYDDYLAYVSKKKERNYCCDLELKTGATVLDLDLGCEIKSVIVFFLPYLTKETKESSGNISKYARGTDYHIRAKLIFEPIILELLKLHPNHSFFFQCDTGIINERFYAGESGLCMLGKNGNLIHEVYGSYGSLALIYTDLKIKEIKTEKRKCLNCGLCQSSCPAKAIDSDGIINSSYCLSYLTQKKGTLDKREEEIVKAGGFIFGCDICQMVCPLNSEISLVSYKDEYTFGLNLKELSSLNKRAFKEKYGKKAFSWRGKKILERNIKLMEDV